MSRRYRPRAAREHARRASDVIPLPRHPYRDSAIFYAILAGALVGVAALTGGELVWALAAAGGFWVIATAFSWWRFRERLARERLEESSS